MRQYIALFLVLLILLVAVPSSASFYCKYAAYNPTYAVICFWEIMMDMWDPLDWGDGDADDYGSGSVLQQIDFYYCMEPTFAELPRAG
jgi:hypothetical protein